MFNLKKCRRAIGPVCSICGWAFLSSVNAGEIKGTVINENGFAAAGARIELYNFSYSSSFLYSSTTDANGFFLLSSIPENEEFNIKIVANNYPPQWFNPDINTQLPQFKFWAPYTMYDTLFIELTQTPVNNSPGIVTVSFTDTLGNSLRNIPWFELRSVDNGTYIDRWQGKDSVNTVIFESVPPGRYSISISGDNYPYQYYNPNGNTTYESYSFPVISGETNSITVNMTNRPLGNGIICGVVTSNGTAIGGVSVALHYRYDTSGTPIYSTASGTDGRFSFEGIPQNNEYYIELSASGYPQQWYSPDGNTAFRQFFVYPGYTDSVMGSWVDTLYVDLIQTPVDNSPAILKVSFIDTLGYPISDIPWFELRSVDNGSYIDRWQGRDSANTVTFESLLPGEYYISISGGDYPSQYYNPDGNTTYESYSFPIISNEVKSVTVNMTQRPLGNGVIRGIVKANGTTIGGAGVALYYRFDASAMPIYSTTSRADGRFSFEGIPQNIEYYIELSASGYPQQWYSPDGNTVFKQFYVYAGYVDSVMGGWVDTLLVNLTQTPIDNSPAMLKVSFTDTLGYPLSYIPWFELKSADNGFYIDRWQGTDSANTVTFESLLPGRYSVSISGGDYPYQYYNPDGNTTNESYFLQLNSYEVKSVAIKMTKRPTTVYDTTYYDTTNQDSVLYGAVAGNILDTEKRPVGNASIIILTPNGESVGFGISDTSGRYTISRVPAMLSHIMLIRSPVFPGQYWNIDKNTSDMNSASLFTVAVNDTAEINIIIIADPFDTSGYDTTVQNEYVTISGTVRARTTGLPLKGVSVMALKYDEMANNFSNYPSGLFSPYKAMTDSAGRYLLNVWANDNYFIFANSDSGNYVCQFYSLTDNINNAMPISAPQPGTTLENIDFNLRIGGTVKGMVKTSTGTPIPNINVEIWENEGSHSYRAITGTSGEFTSKGLPNGRYHINIYTGSFILSNQYMPDFEVIEGQTVQLQPVTMEMGGHIWANITLPATLDSSKFYPRMFNILLFSDTALNSDHSSVWPERFVSAYCISPTELVSDACPSGTWRVVITPQPTVWYTGTATSTAPITQSYVSNSGWTLPGTGASLFTSPAVTVNKQDTTDINVNYRQGYSVFGSVTGENGESFGYNDYYGYKWYDVEAFIKDNGKLILVTKSFDIGNNRFEIPGLINGQEYFIHVSADGYPGSWWSPFSGNTAKPDQPYRFSTTGFVPMDVQIISKPAGYEEGGEEYSRPSAVQNLKVSAVDLETFKLTWNRLPATENVKRYRIYRLVSPLESDFVADTFGWEPVDDSSIMAKVDSFSTADTLYFDNSVIPNTVYMYVVAGMDSAGHEGRIDLPSNLPLSTWFHRISYDSFAKSANLAANRWHMAGICGTDSVNFIQTEDLFIYKWDDLADQDDLYNRYQRVGTTRAGKGYWMYSAASLPITMIQASFNNLANNRNSINVMLKYGQTGWNQISSPFPYPVSPSWLGSGYSAFEWVSELNQYREVEELQPFKAYWVYNIAKKDTTLSIPPARSKTTGNLLAKRASHTGWELTVSLEGASSSDPDNFIGVSTQNALVKEHINRTPEPPRAFDFAQLYLLDNDVKLSRFYMTSPAVPNKKLEWMTGISPSSETMRVNIGNISSLPEEVYLFWIDEKGALDLRDTCEIVIAPHTETRFGYIVATSNPSDVALYTGRFCMMPSYPNPFNRATTIEFFLPYSWNANGSKGNEICRVSLAIYNVAGQKVKTLASGAMKVGSHRMVWDGKNEYGNSVSSGFYIARLTNGKQAQNIKMFKIN